MKKLIMLSIAALLTAGFIGCGAEDEATTLRWKNTNASVASDYVGIQWVDYSTTQANQTWDSVPAQNDFSTKKDVSALTGSGNVVDGAGDTADIVLDDTDPSVAGVAVNGTSSVVLEKNADATLVIGSAKKK